MYSKSSWEHDTELERLEKIIDDQEEEMGELEAELGQAKEEKGHLSNLLSELLKHLPQCDKCCNQPAVVKYTNSKGQFQTCKRCANKNLTKNLKQAKLIKKCLEAIRREN